MTANFKLHIVKKNTHHENDLVFFNALYDKFASLIFGILVHERILIAEAEDLLVRIFINASKKMKGTHLETGHPLITLLQITLQELKLTNYDISRENIIAAFKMINNRNSKITG